MVFLTNFKKNTGRENKIIIRKEILLLCTLYNKNRATFCNVVYSFQCYIRWVFILLHMNRLNKTESSILISLMCSLLPEDVHSELIETFII